MSRYRKLPGVRRGVLILSIGAVSLLGLSGCASADHEDGGGHDHHGAMAASQPASQPASRPASQPAEMSAETSEASNAGRELVEKMVEVVGSMDDLKAMKDVEYTYTYGDAPDGKVDVSTERYVFDGEYSWAKYSRREKVLMPHMKGELVQGYDGDETWVTLDGVLQEGGMLLKMSDFLRKTNYYWLTMMQKLLDPGTNYAHEGARTVEGVEYELVRITYGENVGDVQDTYLLYINPETHLVDQFLFTVMDFNRTVPSLMKVEYETFGEIMLPTKRKYADSNWEGEVAEDAAWTDEICEDLQFGNGFAREDFQKPVTAAPASMPAGDSGEAM